MRKTIIVVALLLAVLAMPVVAATYSNPVGFVKVDLLLDKFQMVGEPLSVNMALNDSDTGISCAGEMLAENLKANSYAGGAAQIMRFDASGQSFSTVYLYYASWDPGNVNNYKWVYLTFPVTAADWVLNVGEGVYLKRATVGAASVDAVNLGDVNVADTTTLTILPNFNMITYPYPVDAPLNDSWPKMADGAKANSYAGGADSILMYDPVGNSFTTVYLYYASWDPGNVHNDKWVYLTFPVTDATEVIDPGDAVYYNRQPAEGALTWDVGRPFSLD